MIFLKLRQAECAMDAGRLDEAFEILRANDIRSHRKGQSLVSQLTDELIDRSESHLRDARPDHAYRDCDKAARLAGNQTRIASLWKRIIHSLPTPAARSQPGNRQSNPTANMHADSTARTVIMSDYRRPSPKVSPRPQTTMKTIELHIDGAGSYIICPSARVTFGAASHHSERPLVRLAVGDMFPTLTIERDEEDYFLTTTTDIQVNRKSTSSHMLQDGDRITASRCRFKFKRPNPSSASAVIDLAGVRVPDSDARQVILMDRSIVIGPTPAAHIRVPHMSDSIILTEHEGRLRCRTELPIHVADSASPRPASDPLPADSYIEIGDLSFVITRG